MELKNVRFGVEIEMFGYYTDEEFINVIHKELEKRLLPIKVVNARALVDTVPEGYWAFKSDGSIRPPEKAIATNIQQTGYRKGEQHFLPFGKIPHVEPETGIHIPDKERHDRTISLYADRPELPFSESRITNRPEINLGDEKLKAFKIKSDYNTFELISPPLKFVDSNIKLVAELADVLRRMRMKVNASTGLHVHVSFPNINLFAFLKIFHFINEHKIYEMWPTRINNQFAAPKEKMEDRIDEFLRNVIHDETLERNNYARINNLASLADEIGERYFGINTQSFEAHGTIEFRYASSTVKSDKITEWLDYLRDLVAYCYNTKEIKGLLDGKYDVKEEKEGLLEITKRLTNGEEVVVKTNTDLIDKFANQDKGITEFLKEHGRDDPLKVKVLIYNYINGIDDIKYKQVSNVFVNLIKFINEALDASLIEKDDFFNFLFVEFANKHEETDFYEKVQEMHQNDDEHFSHYYLRRDNLHAHADTIFYIFEKTIFKLMSKKQILERIVKKIPYAMRTESGEDLVISIISRLKIPAEEMSKLSFSNVKSIVGLLTKRANGFIDDDEQEMLYKTIIEIIENIGKEKAESLFPQNPEEAEEAPVPGLDFDRFLRMVDYDQDRVFSIVGTNKDFFLTQLEFFVEADREDYIKQVVPIFLKILEPKILIQKIEIFKRKRPLDVSYVYKLFGKSDDSDVINFLDYYLKDRSREKEFGKFFELLHKYHTEKDLSVFDMYEMIKNLREKEKSSYILDVVYDLRDVLKKEIYIPLITSARCVISVSKTPLLRDLEENKDKPEILQPTIDLLKLVFKKFPKGSLISILTLNNIGIRDFNKVEYVKDLSQEAIEKLVLNIKDADIENEGCLEFLHLVLSQKEDTKTDFEITCINNGRLSEKKFKKVVGDDIDINKLLDRAETTHSKEQQIEFVSNLLGSKYDFISQFNFDKNQFAKRCANVLKIKTYEGVDSLYYLSEIVNTMDDYVTNSGEFISIGKDVYEHMDEQTRLFLKILLSMKFQKMFDVNEIKKEVLVKLKDKEFATDFVKIYNNFNGRELPFVRKAEDVIDILSTMDKSVLKENDKIIKRGMLSRMIPKSGDNLNYTKLFSLPNEILIEFLDNYLSHTTNNPTQYFIQVKDILAPIYDKMMAKKGLIKELNKIFSKYNAINYIDYHFHAMFFYNKLKKHNFKFTTHIDKENPKIYSIEIDFNMGRRRKLGYPETGVKKYKIRLSRFFNEKFSVSEYTSRRYGANITLFKDNNVLFDKSLTESRNSDILTEIFYDMINSVNDKPLKTLFKYKAKGSKIEFEDFIYYIITHGVQTIGGNPVMGFETKFGNSEKPKKITESVKQAIDYNKEFKRIMIERGLSEAKKFLTENKNNITDKKLTAVMKQFSIR